MKLLLLLCLVAVSSAQWTKSLEDELTNRLSEFVKKGGNLASKKAADLIVKTVAEYDTSETGFSSGELKKFSRLLTDYLSGMIDIYRSRSSILDKGTEVALLNLQMLQKLRHIFRDYTVNMSATFLAIGNALVRVIISQGYGNRFPMPDHPIQLTNSTSLTDELVENLENLLANGTELTSVQGARIIITTIGTHDSSESGLSKKQLSQMIPYIRDFVAGINEIYKQGENDALIHRTVRKYTLDKFVHLRQIFDDEVGFNALYCLGDIASAVGIVINWQKVLDNTV